jgi:uncharacterized protein YbbC (DUF1343 family)
VHDPVSKYLPEFAAEGKQDITIEQLLLHRGGLIADNPMKDFEQGKEKSWEKILSMRPTYPPGTRFVYSDVSFMVLGRLVEKVTGQSLDQFAKAEIFQPLGMKDTGYNPSSSLQDRIAPTQQRDGKWMLGEVHDPRAYALGGVAGHAGVFSTAGDVARWCRMLLNGGELDGHRILSQATVQQMTAEHCLPDGKGCRGYGLDIDSRYSNSVRGNLFPRHTSYGHTGYTGTSYWIDPVDDCFVVLLTNRVHPNDTRRTTRATSHLRRAAANAVAAAFDVEAAPVQVLCGIDVLERDHFKQLDGRRVGLITNVTGRNHAGERDVDLFAKAGNFKLVKLFSPEHGLDAKRDEKIGDDVDQRTGLHVYSLYGKTTRPTAEMLAGIDTLVFDIQDVGARFYTYSATLGICMEEAARNKIKFVVLDRPNPIGPLGSDGPIADKEFYGFTAYGPIPVMHGMTFGELAGLFNKEYGKNCDLTVIQMKDYRRDLWFDKTSVPWVNPSPNMRNLNEAILYTGICLLEATNISVGRGTDSPFELFGAPWIDGPKLSAALNDAKIDGLKFTPITFTPTSSVHKGKECQGVKITITDRDYVEPVRAGVTIVWTLNKLFGEKFEVQKVVRLLQNRAAMEAILKAADPDQIPKSWEKPLEAFQKLREKYLLYQ